MGYDNESIKALSQRDSVRTKPDVWLQGHDLNAVKHTLVEIVGNAVDEVKYCQDKGLPCRQKIIVKRHSDNAMSVQDFGRGIPVDWNSKENKFNYELIFMTTFAGGKYDNQGGYGDGFVVGMNGVGLTVTQFTSEYMYAEIRRDGKKYTLNFKDGFLVDGMVSEEADTVGAGKTGSFIKWKPSKDVFTETEVEDGYFEELLKGISIASNVNIEFEDEVTGSSLKFEGVNYKDFFTQETSPMSSYETFNGEGTASDGKSQEKYAYTAEGIVAITDKPKLYMYHNMIGVANGIHKDAIQTAMARALNRESSFYVYKADCEGLMKNVSVFLITRSTKTSYDGQAKRSVLNAGLRYELEGILLETFTKLFAKNPEVKDYLLKLLKHKKKAEEDAQKIEKTAKKIRKVQEKLLQEETIKIDKFVDCLESHNTELYIVEGDSALASCKTGRNAQFQAITAIRGKILNCLKQPKTSILSNEIVMRLMKIIGEEPEISNIRIPSMGKKWDKIIICTDADEDGYQIRTLLITFFYVVYPQLLEQGRVYIVESPLFEIETSDKSYFAHSIEQRDEIIEDLQGNAIKVKAVHRSKGLGENDPQMMWDTTMNPETRKLVQVQYTPDDEFASLTIQMFEALLGDDLESRRELIAYYMAEDHEEIA